MKSVRAVLGAMLVWLLASVASAQAVAGSQLAGVIKDSSGGVLPGALVTIVKTDTAMTRTATTGADGSFVFPNLPVGPYQLKVAMDGFNTLVQDGIVLQVNTNPTLDLTLTVGSIGEQVTVAASSAMIEAVPPASARSSTTSRSREIPLNGRQATELIFLSGLATSAPAGDLNTNKNYPTVTISVAGGQANGITYIMDGGTHNDPFNNLNLPTPFPDALQEFKVETSSLPARYGHHAASAVNLVTKSGTNAFHGNVFEFVRDYHFNARNFFAATRDSLKRNQFGGTLGGPLLKDKLFFFGGYQGRVEKTNPPTTVSFVPTAAMLAGDFSAIASPACSGRQITLAPAAGFVNNTISPTAFNPVAMNFLEHVPVSSDPCGRLQYGVPNDNTEHQSLGRGDYTLSNSQSLFARYMYAVYDNPGTYDGKNALTLSRTGQNNQVHSLVAGHNWMVSAGDGELVPRDLEPHRERPADAVLLLAVRPRRQRLQPSARLHGRERHERLQHRDRRHQPRILQLRQPSDRQRRRRSARPPSAVVRRQLDPHQDRNGEQPSDQRAVHLQRPVDRPGAGGLHARARQQFRSRQPGVRLRRERLRRRLRAGRMEAAPEPDVERRGAMGTLPADQELAGLRQQLRRGAVRRRHPQHGVPAGAGRPAVSGRRWLPGFRGDEEQAQSVRATRRAGVAAERADGAPRRVGPLLRHAAPVLQYPLREQPAVGRPDHADQPAGRVHQPVCDLPGRQPVSGVGHRLDGSALPDCGCLRERAARHQADHAAAVEPGCAATDCRLAGDGELSRESLQPPVARDRTELRGVHAGRNHRDHERAPAPGAQEPGTGRVLRDHRTAGRHRPRDLSRHAAVGPAPVEGRAQRARQLHAVQVQERSRDDRDHRADHHRPDQSRSRLLVLRLGSPARR